MTAVKTDQGVRVFNRGLHGPRHLHEYLQEIADNFYSPCGKGPGTLSIFRIETSSKRLMEMSRQPGRCFPASQPGLEVFGSYRPVASFDLSPTAANLDRFVTAGSLELSRRNLDIMTLQDIAEKGYAHLALEEPFRYRREFAPVEKELGKLSREKELHPDFPLGERMAELRETSRKIAAALLAREGVRTGMPRSETRYADRISRMLESPADTPGGSDTGKKRKQPSSKRKHAAGRQGKL